ncbi:MAG UNVERIFIED_CONTAM: DUF4785 family protein [Microcystis novacekii LVE1205-3]|jgi:hypothetical protein
MSDKPETAQETTKKNPSDETTSKSYKERILAVAPEGNIYINNIGVRCNPIAGENSSECTLLLRAISNPELSELYNQARIEIPSAAGDLPSEAEMNDLADMYLLYRPRRYRLLGVLARFPPAGDLPSDSGDQGKKGSNRPGKVTFALGGTRTNEPNRTKPNQP